MSIVDVTNRFYSFQEDASQLIYVERGLVPVLWAQPRYDWGAVGVTTIVDKLLLKKTVPRNIRMELIRVPATTCVRTRGVCTAGASRFRRSTSRSSRPRACERRPRAVYQRSRP
jgi:hypothetical protein